MGGGGHPTPTQQQHPLGPQSQHPQSMGPPPTLTPMQPMIDAGRTVVHAPAKPAEPVFVAPPNSIQVKRVMHSEAYVK
jgi:hypothetical protein